MRKQAIAGIGILLLLILAFVTVNCQPAVADKTTAPKQCPLAAMGVPCSDNDGETGKVCPISQGKDPCDSCVSKAKEIQGESEIEKLDAQFNRHLAAKEYDQALSALDRIDKALPVNSKLGLNPQVVNARAYVYMQKPDYNKALESYNQLLKAWPNHADSLYNIACIESIRGNKAAACDCLDRAVKSGYYDWQHMEQDADLNNIRNEGGYKQIRDLLKAKYPVINRASGCGGDCSSCPSQVKEAVHSGGINACSACPNNKKCDSANKCVGGDACKCSGANDCKCDCGCKNSGKCSCGNSCKCDCGCKDSGKCSCGKAGKCSGHK